MDRVCVCVWATGWIVLLFNREIGGIKDLGMKNQVSVLDTLSLKCLSIFIIQYMLGMFGIPVLVIWSSLYQTNLPADRNSNFLSFLLPQYYYFKTLENDQNKTETGGDSILLKGCHTCEIHIALTLKVLLSPLSMVTARTPVESHSSFDLRTQNMQFRADGAVGK